jgi:hypothetical protein
MRVLLSDGSGLTARQTAWLLRRNGHEVGVLTSDPWALTRFTSAVRRLHRVPPYGDDPLTWVEAALTIARDYDVLLPTQEQAAVLALVRDRIGAKTAVPDFAALRRVQDKVSAERLLVELGLPRPPGYIAHTPAQLRAGAFLKAPIGTASQGVHYVRHAHELPAVAATLVAQRAFELGGVLVQERVEGTLLMVQAVFADGRLLALHANTRDRTGSGGGAVHKTSVSAEPLVSTVERIGAALRWHGALSLDAIDAADGPVVIDVNPRLVEPGNAALAGLDLVDLLCAVARGDAPHGGLRSRPGVRTHQLVLGLLSAAAERGRRGVAGELCAAVGRLGRYTGSNEELGPLRRDVKAAALLAGLSGALLVAPGLQRRLVAGSVASYALTPAGWRKLTLKST